MGQACSFDRYRQAHVGICAATLPPSTRRVAHELLTLVNVENGQVNLTWEELAYVTGCENVNASRRHLSRLSAAGLIHYSTNDYVYVTWMVWMGEEREPARPRAETSALTRPCDAGEGDEEMLFGSPTSAPTRQNQRAHAPEPARPRANHSYARLLVSQSIDHPIEKGEETNKLTPRRGLSVEEQKRSIALLMDEEVGVEEMTARWLARSFPFEQLVRQVMSWRRQLAGGMVQGNGALVHRIKAGFGASVTEKDRESALYRRHHAEDLSGYSMDAFLAREQRGRYRVQ